MHSTATFPTLSGLNAFQLSLHDLNPSATISWNVRVCQFAFEPGETLVREGATESEVISWQKMLNWSWVFPLKRVLLGFRMYPYGASHNRDLFGQKRAQTAHYAGSGYLGSSGRITTAHSRFEETTSDQPRGKRSTRQREFQVWIRLLLLAQRNEKSGSFNACLFPQETDERDGNVRYFLTKFAERTSLQGIPYIYVVRLVYRKIFWTVLFILMTLATLAHLSWLIYTFVKVHSGQHLGGCM